MGAITGALGLGGGAGGTSFGGPSMASQQGNNNMQAAFAQLQNVANGTGPNPAQAQYQANVQNLAKQQAVAIGSIQGISPALAARMASQQGSAAMQNAAAQGQANTQAQQLGAMSEMGNIGGMQQGAANQMMANMNTTNAGLAQQTMQNQAGMVGGLAGGLGASGVLGSGIKALAIGGADGGMVGQDFGSPVKYYNAPPLDVTGQGVTQSTIPPAQQAKTRSLLSQFLSGQPAVISTNSGPLAMQKGLTMLGASLAKNPTPQNTGQGPTTEAVEDLPSPYPNNGILPSGNSLSLPYGLGYGANPVAPSTPGFAKGGQAKDFRSGGNVKAGGPSQKAVKKGNSYANDKIPALLSEGEVVIPRNVMQSADPVRASADFVANVIAKRRGRK